MAKVYEKGEKGKGKEIEGSATITEAQARAREKWNATKSPEAKRARVLARQEARDSLSATEQLALLNKRLGKGIGAVKERARLAKN